MSNEFTAPSYSSNDGIKLSPENDNTELNTKNNKVEIKRPLSTVTRKSIDKEENIDIPVEDERIAKVNFHCSSCDMQEMVQYLGTQPPFVFGIKFVEPTYVLRDPFQAPPPRWKPKAEYFVALGAHCRKCDNVVCKDTECSFFYIRTYCLPCALDVVSSFPLDIQLKLKKQMAT